VEGVEVHIAVDLLFVEGSTARAMAASGTPVSMPSVSATSSRYRA
jgi:hypothetical protein